MAEALANRKKKLSNAGISWTPEDGPFFHVLDLARSGVTQEAALRLLDCALLNKSSRLPYRVVRCGSDDIVVTVKSWAAHLARQEPGISEAKIIALTRPMVLSSYRRREGGRNGSYPLGPLVDYLRQTSPSKTARDPAASSR